MKYLISIFVTLIIQNQVHADFSAPPNPTYDGARNPSCGWLYTPKCTRDAFGVMKTCTCELQVVSTAENSSCGEGETPVTRADTGAIVCLASDGSVKDSKSVSSSAETQGQCKDALTKTEKQCKGAEWSQYSAAAIQTAMSVMSLKNAGNTKAACEAAQKVNGIGALSNAAVSAYCYKAISSCKKTCNPDGQSPEASEQCDAFNTHAGLAGKQAVENATAYAGSAACANAAAGKCIGQEAYNDEECTQFCMKPGRQEHPKCALALNNCSNAAYAAKNVQYCTCLSNPLSPSCRANAGTPVPGSGNPSGLNLDDDGIGDAGYDFNGVDAQGKAANTNSGDGGGGGFNAGGGGSSAFGDSGGGGSGDEPLNKEILTGTGGAAGAGGGFFGGGGYGEGNSAKGGSKSGEEKGIDLSAFLPGGKQDPTRNPASAGYGDPTITKANGLTNWQKVTRKLNEKRPELMP